MMSAVNPLRRSSGSERVRDIAQLKERYLQNPFEKQIGNLASDFSRLEEACGSQKTPANCNDLLQEIEYCIGWSMGAEGSIKTKEILADLQMRVATWRLVWPRLGKQPEFRNAVAREAHAWAQKLLKLAK